jgi:hypothetical protein
MIFEYTWANLCFVASTLIAACVVSIPGWRTHPAKRVALAVVLMQSACIAYAGWGLHHRNQLLLRDYRDYHFEDHGLGLSLLSLCAAIMLCFRSRNFAALLACASVTWLLIVWLLIGFTQY